MSAELRLDKGQPPFDVPQRLRDALGRADRISRYSPGVGVDDYRMAATQKLDRVNEIATDWRNVVYTQGSTQGLVAAMSVACRPGDTVAIPWPGYPNYTDLAAVLGLRVVHYPALPSDEAWLREVDLTLSRDRPTAIVLNYPHNPTGADLSPSQAEALFGVLRRHDVWTIADECYDELGARPSRATMMEQLGDRLVMCFSMSKSHAVPSWRMGYAWFCPELIDSATRFQEVTLGCGNSDVQLAACDVLRSDASHVQEFARAYDDVVHAVAGISPGLRHLDLVTTGTMYSWFASVDRVAIDVDRVAAQTGVRVSPGGLYGPSLDGYFRVAHVEPLERIVKAIESIDACLAPVAAT